MLILKMDEYNKYRCILEDLLMSHHPIHNLILKYFLFEALIGYLINEAMIF